MIEKLAQVSGAGVDEIKLLVVILVQIPISFIYRAIPISPARSNLSRKLFGGLVGLFSDLYLFGLPGMSLIIFNILLMYKISFFCKDPKTTIKINFLAFSFLCIINIWRLIVDYEGNSNNVCLLAMLTVPKQIYFNWHIFNQLKSNAQNPPPPLLDYICYVLNYIGSIATPVYSYEEYDHFIKQTFKEDKVNIRQIVKKSLSGFSALFIIILSGKYFDNDLIMSSHFRDLNIIYQILYLTVAGCLVRIKYYIIWHFSEIPAAIGNLRGSENNYATYVKSIHPKAVEFNNSPKVRIEKWNMTIAKWLKDCFYLPLIENYKLNKNSASTITFILSAFWHGFYPTYYISFFAINIVSLTEKLMFAHPDLFWFFPSFFYRLQFDIGGLLFKRYLFREWILVFGNTWRYFIWIFIVYYGAKFMVLRKVKLSKISDEKKSR